MWNRGYLKNRAKDALRNNYGSCVLAALIMGIMAGTNPGATNGVRWNIDSSSIGFPALGIIIGAFGVMGIMLLLSIFVANVFTVGGCRFFIENRDYNAPFSKVLSGFKSGYYGNVVLGMFMMDLYIFLWSLLLIVPGIIKQYEYRMVPYILAEQPDISYTEALSISREMMTGQKWDAFVLDLSFIGWYLFAGITCGIGGLLWTAPYKYAADAELYGILREDWMHRYNYDQEYTQHY